MKEGETMTRNGIEYNLEKSPFKVKMHGFTFVFSSEMHLKKFLNGIYGTNALISESLSNRFNLFINAGILATLHLYTKIETRGFLIYNEKGEKICRNKIKLNIENQT